MQAQGRIPGIVKDDAGSAPYALCAPIPRGDIGACEGRQRRGALEMLLDARLQ